jgi:hypothetical protein
MEVHKAIRRGHTTASEAGEAVAEFHQSVAQPEMDLVVFFCSSEYDLEVLAREMSRLFEGVSVVGCTTSGEIGPGGYCDLSLSGFSFAKDVCTSVVGRIDRLQEFSVATGQLFVRTLLQRLEAEAPQACSDNTFSFLLIDGLSVREEPVASAFQNALGDIRLCGGSAGDGLNFQATYVYHDGHFSKDSAVLVLGCTPLPFKVFKTQHFVASDCRMVVTAADSERRVVREINGLPAAEEYAQMIDVKVEDLNPNHFATSPVVVRIGDLDYVRSIQKANPDGSLTFYCAIEEGLVLRIAKGADIVETLERTFEDIDNDLGPTPLVLGFDCILRNLELSQRGLKDRVGELIQQHNVVGFSTYGEQYGGVHVNQTLTGIAFGMPGGKLNG